MALDISGAKYSYNTSIRNCSSKIDLLMIIWSMLQYDDMLSFAWAKRLLIKYNDACGAEH